MHKELLLLRHGKSDWSGSQRDFERPLKKRGKLAAQRMGEYLKTQHIVPDLILSSPAERAKTTAIKLAKAMGKTSAHVTMSNFLYAAKVDDFIHVIRQCPEDKQRILIVSHNPGLEQLTRYLCNNVIPQPADGKLVPTTTLVHFEIPGSWQANLQRSAHLISITRPSQLPTSFAFHTYQGTEQRIRPAYYYSQSAALPFRIQHDKLQVLFITSSGNNHWTIPKGIIEPGLSAYDSASKEAREEAGIKGIISHQMLGCYHYEKWGANCTVQVFPMQVTEELLDDRWEEQHRQRQWLCIADALPILKIDGIKKMLILLEDKFRESAP